MRVASFAAAAILLVGGARLIAGDRVPAGQPAQQSKLDAYGDPLPEGAYARFGSMRFLHHALAVAFVDDKTIVSVGSSIRYWDAATGRLIREIREDRIADSTDAIICDNATRVITYDETSGTQVWRIGGGRIAREFKLKAEGARFQDARSLSASADGSRFVESFSDGAANAGAGQKCAAVHSLRPNTSTFRLSTGADDIGCFAISPDGSLIATIKEAKSDAGSKSSLVYWDAATGKQLSSQDPIIGGVTEIQFTPSGKGLVLVGESYVALRAIEGNELWRRPTEGQQHYIAGLSRDRLVLLSDKTEPRELHARVVDIANGLMVGRWIVPGSAVGAAAISPDGQRIVLASGERMHVFGFPKGAEISKPLGHSSGISTTNLTPDGRFVVTADGVDKEAIVWDVANGRMIRRLQGHEQACRAAGFSDDGKVISTSADDGTVRIWEAATGRQLFKLGDFEQPVGWSLPLPNSRKVALIGAAGGQITIYDYARSQQIGELKLDQPIAPGMVYCAGDGRLLAAFPCEDPNKSDSAHKVIGLDLWNVEARRMIRHFDGFQSSSFFCAISADMRTLCTYGSDGMVRLWEVASGKLRMAFRVRAEIEEPGDATQPIDFSIDGRTIACADGARLDLWDLPTGARFASINGHEQPITTVDFTPDGRRLLTGSDDTTLLGWDMTRQEWRSRPLERSLGDRDLLRAWEQLSSADAAEAFRARWALAGDPQKTVALFRERLRREATVSKDRIRSWISELDSPRYAVRDRAHGSLVTHVYQAESELRQAIAGRISVESRNRITRILEESFTAIPSPVHLREMRAVEILEQIGTPQARDLLRHLAAAEAPTRISRDAAESLKRLESRPR